MRRAEATPATAATVELTFEGRAVAARIGESVAAALTAAGIRGLRRTESGGERGLFCGMGVCQDCLVEIDGESHQRACMTKVSGPHRIARQPALATPGASAHAMPVDAELPVRTPDIAVIGGGAGGLTAAAIAAEAGADVLLIDERPVPGGQFYKQPAGGLPPDADAQFRDGAGLIARLRKSGARRLEGAAVWGAFAPLELAVTGPDGSLIVRPRRLIVATGAYERALPLPGWTLPGVMTTGAAQTLLRSYGVLAGQRVLVAGNGPLNFQVALELAQAGAEIVAVAELSPRPGLAAAAALWDMLAADPRLLGRGVLYLTQLRRRRVPVLRGHCLIGVAADGGGLRATLGRWDGSRMTAGPAFSVDAVTMGYGFLPANEVLRALGAAQDFDPRHRLLATRRDQDGRTSVEHLYGVGDCCGLGGAQAAQEEGTLAALAALASLGHAVPPALAAQAAPARARLRRQRRFQRGLWRVFAAADPSAVVATADTTICRCEEVTRARAEAAMQEGAPGPGIGAVKRLTRIGMGRCQGRYCGPVLAAMLAQRNGSAIDEAALFAPRPPIKPVRIADLVRPAAS